MDVRSCFRRSDKDFASGLEAVDIEGADIRREWKLLLVSPVASIAAALSFDVPRRIFQEPVVSNAELEERLDRAHIFGGSLPSNIPRRPHFAMSIGVVLCLRNSRCSDPDTKIGHSHRGRLNVSW
jgi:hypothetical protein